MTFSQKFSIIYSESGRNPLPLYFILYWRNL
nr:MAG TPA: hypothetical protein [Caudoviricetes sp.]